MAPSLASLAMKVRHDMMRLLFGVHVGGAGLIGETTCIVLMPSCGHAAVPIRAHVAHGHMCTRAHISPSLAHFTDDRLSTLLAREGDAHLTLPRSFHGRQAVDTART
jgi:hypothetical protein